MSERIAVVLMAYGTPGSPDEIEEYYTDIRRGRPPTPEQLAELTGRYAAIAAFDQGRLSPLAARTEEQRAAVQAALDELAPATYTVVLGLKHSHPKIEDAVAGAIAAGHRTIVAAVLAPHFSEMSIGEYLHRASAAADASGEDVEVRAVRSWARLPEFVEFVADDLQHRLDAADAAREQSGANGRTRVLFTAHSLPARIIAAGDPYPAELRATAEAVAERLGLREGGGWQIAWQSAGRTPEPWLGPDVGEVIRSGDLAGVDTLIVSAVGFVSDHLEVLYDLDLEARHLADEAGLAFDRTSCVNADPTVMSGLARLIHQAPTLAERA